MTDTTTKLIEEARDFAKDHTSGAFFTAGMHLGCLDGRPERVGQIVDTLRSSHALIKRLIADLEDAQSALQQRDTEIAAAKREAATTALVDAGHDEKHPRCQQYLNINFPLPSPSQTAEKTETVE